MKQKVTSVQMEQVRFQFLFYIYIYSSSVSDVVIELPAR